MDLSVIIVNYNVKALLEQTLLSVYKAKDGLEIEVIVVDNHSADDSCEMVREKFPGVILIDNSENLGFSKANNQGIEKSKGRNVLLLNPDTVLSEDTLVKTVSFLDKTQDAGALGVRMIDGSGNFLPESKRGLPTPAVAFYKMTGLARMFPKSKTFGAYHLSYLDEHKNHRVDILSGAFFMVKKAVLDEVGLLDEAFFMYGEDIDLSYRIVKAGYNNYYFADTTIIHYKGESTKKHSVNYVRIFYLAMAKFAAKHFSRQQGRWFALCINLAIFVRAAVALAVRVYQSFRLVLADFIIIFAGYYGLMRYWEIYNKYVVGGFYPPEYIRYHIPAYIALWIGGIAALGGYSDPFRLTRTVRGVVFGSLALLSVYALLPESMRFSRALILLGSVWALLATVFIRLLWHFIRFGHFDTGVSMLSQVLVIGSKEECERVKSILLHYPNRFKLIGFIKPDNSYSGEGWIGSADNISVLAEIYRANEIIFCARDISSTEIMQIMGLISGAGVQYKILPEKGSYIIGSNSKNTTGELFSIVTTPALGNPSVRKIKRIFDIGVCIFMIPAFPLLLFKRKFMKPVVVNWFDCLLGKKTWVSYHPPADMQHLPPLQHGVFNTGHEILKKTNDRQFIHHINLIYASDYRWQNDLDVLVKAFFSNNFASLKGS